MTRISKLLFIVASIGAVLFFQLFLSGSSANPIQDEREKEYILERMLWVTDSIFDQIAYQEECGRTVTNIILSKCSRQDIRNVREEIERLEGLYEETKYQINLLKSIAKKRGVDLEGLLGERRYFDIYYFGTGQRDYLDLLEKWALKKEARFNEKNTPSSTEEKPDATKWVENARKYAEANDIPFDPIKLKFEIEREMKKQDVNHSFHCYLISVWVDCLIEDINENSECNVDGAWVGCFGIPGSTNRVKYMIKYDKFCPSGNNWQPGITYNMDGSGEVEYKQLQDWIKRDCTEKAIKSIFDHCSLVYDNFKPFDKK